MLLFRDVGNGVNCSNATNFVTVKKKWLAIFFCAVRGVYVCVLVRLSRIHWMFFWFFDEILFFYSIFLMVFVGNFIQFTFDFKRKNSTFSLNFHISTLKFLVHCFPDLFEFFQTLLRLKTIIFWQKHFTLKISLCFLFLILFELLKDFQFFQCSRFLVDFCHRSVASDWMLLFTYF